MSGQYLVTCDRDRATLAFCEDCITPEGSGMYLLIEEAPAHEANGCRVTWLQRVVV
jgi:hypothetical protein